MDKLFFYYSHIILVSIMLLSGQLQAASDAFIDVEATLGFDDNVTHSAKNVDIENDSFLTLAVTRCFREAPVC